MASLLTQEEINEMVNAIDNRLEEMNLKYLETLTESEVQRKYAECKRLMEYYKEDGTPKLMPVGLDDVKLDCVLTTGKVITKEWISENEEFYKTLLEWASGIKHIGVLNYSQPYPMVCNEEIERLASMLGGETKAGYPNSLLLIDDNEYSFVLKEYARFSRFDSDATTQRYTLSVRCCNSLIDIIFLCNIVSDEVRKNYELYEKVNEIMKNIE